MATFTIDTENNIAGARRSPRPPPTNRNRFQPRRSWPSSRAGWPISRLVETWNSFAGVAPFDDLKPVKKFTDRKAAVARIWKAVQRLSPDVAPQATPVRNGEDPVEEVPGQGFAARPGAKGRNRIAHQQEGRSNRDDEAREGCDAGRDHGSHGLAEAHGSRLRQHPRQQGRREDRVLEERRRERTYRIAK